MEKERKIFLEQVIVDHVFEILEESVIQIDELIWEYGYRGEVHEDSIPHECRRSKYLHAQRQIITKIFKEEQEVNKFLKEEAYGFEQAGLDSIVTHFDAKGNNSSTEIHRKNSLYCTWVFEYDANANLLARKYMKNEYVQDKYLYDYDDKGNLLSSKYYTDNDSGSGVYYLNEEETYIHDVTNQLVYSEFMENINQDKIFKVIYEIRQAQDVGHQRFSIRTINGMGRQLSNVEKIYNEQLDLISISYFIDDKRQSHSITIDYQYEERGKWIEKRIYNNDGVLFSLRKRKIKYQ